MDRQIRWWIVGGVIVVLDTVSLGVGMISETLHRRASAALDLAHSDDLTGLPNRRILELFLRRAFAAAERGRDLSVALFDVDGFKKHNDAHGHSAGDEVLRLVAAILSANTRTADISGRLGGDEFLTVLSDEGPASARVFAERVQAQLKTVGGAVGEGVRISVGIAPYVRSMANAHDLLRAADKALYQAKDMGGDSAVIYVEPDDGAADEKPEGSPPRSRGNDTSQAPEMIERREAR